MLSAYLVRMVEDHAEKLTKDLLDDLVKNPRTSSYQRLSRDELHRRFYDIYHRLGDWLVEKNEGSIREYYERLGRRRFEEGVPLAEMVYAVTLSKDHLRNYIRSAGTVYSALELHREVELSRLVGRFYDLTTYYAVKGYEDARAEGVTHAAVGSGKKLTEQERPTSIKWVP